MRNASTRTLQMALVTLVLLSGMAMAQTQEEARTMIERAEELRRHYMEQFRTRGAQAAKLETLAEAERVARAAAQNAAGAADDEARAFVVLGSVLRMQRRWQEAAEALAAPAAREDAIGARALVQRARAAMYGPDPDLGATRRDLFAALDRAPEDDAETQHQILAHLAELESYAGNTEAAVALARETADLAAEGGVEDPTALFYARFIEADAFQIEAGLCDYVDTFDRCLRAADAAERAYRDAEAEALSHGWAGLAEQMRGLRDGLNMRRQLIGLRAGSSSFPESVFSPRARGDVLANDAFVPGAGPSDAALAALVGEVATGATARDVYLQAKQTELQGDPDQARALFHEAVSRLEAERGRVDDPRRTGSVIETRVEFYRDAMLHDLHAKDPARAFDTLERFRSRGLAEYLAAPPDRATRLRLARLVGADVELSLTQTHLFNAILDFGATPAAEERRVVSRLAARAASARQARSEVVGALGAAVSQGGDWGPPSLSDIEALAERENLTILQYLVTDTNLIAWAVGPTGGGVRAVFLPRSVLERKVAALRATLVSADRAPEPAARFDETLARQLFLFLIAPLMDEGWISGDRLVIIPQGPLGGLPFEALIDPDSGRRLIEDFAIGYAPNATFLLRERGGDRPRIAVEATDRAERDAFEATFAALRGGFDLRSVESLSPEGLAAGLDGVDLAHVTLHGLHHPVEPLRSGLTLPGPPGASGRPFHAHDMIALPLDGVRLVTLAACESAEAPGTIANESLGMPWALKIAGAESALVARWMISIEATDAWMSAFYRRLGDGEAQGDVLAAARAASLETMRDPDTSHPYFWAGFQPFGR